MFQKSKGQLKIFKIKRIIRHPHICYRLMSLGKPSGGRLLQKPRTEPNVKGFLNSGIVILIIPITTLYLGIKHVYTTYKTYYELKDILEKSALDPGSLPTNLKDIDDLDYKSVKIRGTYDHEHPVFIGPRSYAPTKPRDDRGGDVYARLEREFGYHLIVPFKLADRNIHILVNRGFIGNKTKANYFHDDMKYIKPDGEVEVVGVVRTHHKNNYFKKFLSSLPINERYEVDVEELANFLGTDPVYIEANSASTIKYGGPLGGLTEVTLENPRVGFTVFCFITTIAVTFWWRRAFIRPISTRSVYQQYYKERGYKSS